MSRRDVQLPLAVVPFHSITYYVTDANGDILGCSADEEEAHRIKNETEATMRGALRAEAKR